MKRLITSAVLAACLAGFAAQAQQTPPVMPAPAADAVQAPPDGTLSTTRDSHVTRSDGSKVDSTSSSYRDTDGAANDSHTVTRTAAPPPPVPPTTTTTETDTSTTNAPR